MQGAQTLLVTNAETALKSPKVRSILTNRLVHQLDEILRRKGETGLHFRKAEGRIVVSGVKRMEGSLKALRQMFGVAVVSPCVVTENHREMILGEASRLFDATYESEATFAVRARRFVDLPFTSRDLERELGGLIQQKHRRLTVDLDEPNLIVYIEARRDGAYIYCRRYKGPGGLPYGSQGRVVGLLLCGYDLLAMWLLMRRGAKVIPIYVGDGRPEDVDPLFTEFKRIREVVPVDRLKIYRIELREGNREAVTKRTLYRLAALIAEKEKAKGIVTGERFDLPHGRILNSEDASQPILKPLFLLDEAEIECYRRLAEIACGFENLWKEHAAPDSSTRVQYEALKLLDLAEREYL